MARRYPTLEPARAQLAHALHVRALSFARGALALARLGFLPPLAHVAAAAWTLERFAEVPKEVGAAARADGGVRPHALDAFAVGFVARGFERESAIYREREAVATTTQTDALGGHRRGSNVGQAVHGLNDALGRKPCLLPQL